MIRTPLRPLARILEARRKGENPDAIERENRRLRHEQMRDGARLRAESRLLVLGLAFLCAFVVIGARMSMLAASEAEEPRVASGASRIVSQRADIVDRKGRLLATNMETHALYVHPHQLIDPVAAAKGVAAIFPDLDEERLIKDFTGKRRFLWIKRKISPEQKQAVHDIGEPGLLFGPREMRLYPNGTLAGHILGGTTFGDEGVSAAEIVGVAGVEKTFDDELRDPARGGAPLQLSLDLTIQSTVESVLHGGMVLMNAKGATAILMDVHTGEIVAMTSLPDFDPNHRPASVPHKDPSDSPLFNRAVQGVYELGSTFKVFAVAQALELGLVNPSTVIDIRGPLRWGKFRISDSHWLGKELTVTEVLVKSSNIGTSRIAQMIGGARQKDFLERLGMLVPTTIEMPEAKMGRPLQPSKWSELSAMTISYGHGLSTTPMHLAAAYAAVANGGYRIDPTLIKQDGPRHGERVMSEKTAATVRAMLRLVVGHPDGTANLGDVPGYQVAGKTGTADKYKTNAKGYQDEKVIATFASMFPAKDPAYVLVVTLDEPVETSGAEPRRTAGWTAVPVAAEIIRRVAPLLGMRPDFEPAELAGITLASQ